MAQWQAAQTAEMQLQARKQQQLWQQPRTRVNSQRVPCGVSRQRGVLQQHPPRAQADGGAAALPSMSGAAGGGSSQQGSKPASSSDGDAVYIRSQQLMPGVLEYPKQSVVVVGDVPAGW